MGSAVAPCASVIGARERRDRHSCVHQHEVAGAQRADQPAVDPFGVAAGQDLDAPSSSTARTSATRPSSEHVMQTSSAHGPSPRCRVVVGEQSRGARRRRGSAPTTGGRAAPGRPSARRRRRRRPRATRRARRGRGPRRAPCAARRRARRWSGPRLRPGRGGRHDRVVRRAHDEQHVAGPGQLAHGRAAGSATGVDARRPGARACRR